MRRRAHWRLALGLASLSAVVLSGCGGAAASHGSGDQLRFGVQMARQGLWSEALFRFEKARALEPDNSKVLNNVAVALEAAGRYEEALEVYRKALELDPGNRDLRANYARFADFYESFRPVEAGEAQNPLEGLP